GAVYTLVLRSTPLPPRVPIWVWIYVLYQSSELRAERWSTVLTGDFAYRSGHDLGVCNMLLSLALARSRACWSVRRRIATRNEPPGKRSLCSTLHGDAAVVTFVFNLRHSNWTVWSSRDISKRLLEKIRRTEAAAG